tara:strand:- start:578 stop:868 length:291 start_codon:yes stop_codon:yes gene_type:complete
MNNQDKYIKRIYKLWGKQNLLHQEYQQLNKIRNHIAMGRDLQAYEVWLKSTELKYKITNDPQECDDCPNKTKEKVNEKPQTTKRSNKPKPKTQSRT